MIGSSRLARLVNIIYVCHNNWYKLPTVSCDLLRGLGCQHNHPCERHIQNELCELVLLSLVHTIEINARRQVSGESKASVICIIHAACF